MKGVDTLCPVHVFKNDMSNPAVIPSASPFELFPLSGLEEGLGTKGLPFLVRSPMGSKGPLPSISVAGLVGLVVKVADLGSIPVRIFSRVDSNQ